MIKSNDNKNNNNDNVMIKVFVYLLHSTFQTFFVLFVFY